MFTYLFLREFIAPSVCLLPGGVALLQMIVIDAESRNTGENSKSMFLLVITITSVV